MEEKIRVIQIIGAGIEEKSVQAAILKAKENGHMIVFAAKKGEVLDPDDIGMSKEQLIKYLEELAAKESTPITKVYPLPTLPMEYEPTITKQPDPRLGRGRWVNNKKKKLY